MKGTKAKNKEPTARVWAYLRVSTDTQDNQRLEVLDLVKRQGLGAVEFVEENGISGTVPWRQRALAGILAQMAAGDALVVAELSRLGRSMLEIMEILAEATECELRIYAVKGGWTLDRGSLQSKIVAMVLAMAAEIERDLLTQRTRAALATRKALVAAGQRWTSKSGRTVTRLGRPQRARRLEAGRPGRKIEATWLLAWRRPRSQPSAGRLDATFTPGWPHGGSGRTAVVPNDSSADRGGLG